MSPRSSRIVRRVITRPPFRRPRLAPALALALGLSVLGAAPGAGATAADVNPASLRATPALAPRADAPPGPVRLSDVIPAPLSVAPEGEPFVMRPGTVVSVPYDAPGVRAVGGYLAGLLRPSTGFPLPVVPRAASGSGPAGAIVLRTGDAAGPGDEAYRLTAAAGGVTLEAATAQGLFRAVQTLRQLLPARVGAPGREAGPWTVAGGTVTDRPRYAYRGAMLDVARHFFGVGRVERYIDEIAQYKVNVLHLHLTDDQGWRVAVRSWPLLAPFGGATQVGGGPGGYYTQDDYREIVRYAASRYVTVVPEIDMPAHTNAALASYATLDCDGRAPAPYTGTKVGFSSLCVGEEMTYAFVRDVLREIAALTPGPYVHIGGDEAHATSAADYRTFMDRVQPLVTATGKTVMAWNQITGADMVPGTVVQYWGTTGREAPVIAAARAGSRFVMSPANHTYLDMKYDVSTRLGLTWAGYVEVRDAYDWDPAAFLKGAPASAVLGVEAPLWSETLRTDADIDPMAFPRLPAVAELGWSAPESHDWTAFAARLADQAPRWAAMGIDWYRSPQVPWPIA